MLTDILALHYTPVVEQWEGFHENKTSCPGETKINGNTPDRTIRNRQIQTTSISVATRTAPCILTCDALQICNNLKANIFFTTLRFFIAEKS